MANNYYSRFTTFTAGTTAEAEDVEGEMDAVIAAFDLLPVVNTALVHGSATFVTESGAADAYAVVFNPVRTAYADGDEVVFYATNTNTGASTLKFDSLTTQSIVDPGGNALSASMIISGNLCICRYDASNTQFILVTPTTTTAAATSAAAAAASASAASASETAAAASETAAAASETAAAASAATAATASVAPAFILGLFNR